MDGMRGAACFIVVVFHCLRLSDPNSKFLVIFNGPLCVSLFFVMSGYVLTSAFKRNNTLFQVPARIIRLGLPAVISVAGAILMIGSFHPVLMEGYLKRYSGDLLRITLLINPPLWSIVYELFGSFWVFALVYTAKKSRPVYFALLALSLPAFSLGNLSLFTTGYLLSINMSSERFARINIEATPGVLTLIILILIGFLNNPHFLSGIMNRGKILGLENLPIFSNLSAIGIFLVVSYTSALRRFFTSRPLKIAGELSFPIYLLHCPILFSFGNFVRINFIEHSAGSATLACLSVTIILTGLLSYGFSKLVDLPSLRLSAFVRQPRSYSQEILGIDLN